MLWLRFLWHDASQATKKKIKLAVRHREHRDGFNEGAHGTDVEAKFDVTRAKKIEEKRKKAAEARGEL